MGKRNYYTAQKRRKELKRQEKADKKRSRRLAKKEGLDPDLVGLDQGDASAAPAVGELPLRIRAAMQGGGRRAEGQAPLAEDGL